MKWQGRELRKLAPGVYSGDNGELHIDEREYLLANGYEHNEENCKQLRAALGRLMQQEGVPILDIFHPD